jgi:hypothetical protein
MKAITKTNTVVTGNSITITGELVDVTFPQIIGQRHSIHHNVNGLTHKPRQLQATTHGIMVKRHGANGFLFPKDEFAAVAIEVDGSLTDAPVFVQPLSPSNLNGVVRSEFPVTAVIQQSDDGKTWTDVPNDDVNFSGEKGKWYRCIATNKIGSTTSNSIKL